MSKKVERVDYSARDFLLDVNGLSAFDIGVYWVICSLIIKSRRPIHFQDERIFEIIRSRRPDINAAIHRLCTSKVGCEPMLERRGDELDNKRASDEVEAAAERIRKASDNGSKGGRPRTENVENQQPGKAAGSQTESYYIPHHTIPNQIEAGSHSDPVEDEGGQASRSQPKPPRRYTLDESRQYAWGKVAAAIGDAGWDVVYAAAEGGVEAKRRCKAVARSISVTWIDGMPKVPIEILKPGEDAPAVPRETPKEEGA